MVRPVFSVIDADRDPVVRPHIDSLRSIGGIADAERPCAGKPTHGGWHVAGGRFSPGRTLVSAPPYPAAILAPKVRLHRRDDGPAICSIRHVSDPNLLQPIQVKPSVSAVSGSPEPTEFMGGDDVLTVGWTHRNGLNSTAVERHIEEAGRERRRVLPDRLRDHDRCEQT